MTSSLAGPGSRAGGRGPAARHTGKVVALALAAVTCAAGLSACGGGSDSIAQQAQQGDNKGFVAGDGAIEAIPADKRAGAVTLEGSLLDGTPWKVADQRGNVVVLNVWGSWCPPCQAEMPKLQKAWTTLSAKHPDVRFVGIDTAESAETGAAAVQRYGLTYPSLSDQDRTKTLGLQGKASATPTTLVLDRQGRIAARISGELTSETTLIGMVEDVAKEPTA